MGPEIPIDSDGKLYAELNKSGAIKAFRAAWKIPPEGLASIDKFTDWEKNVLFRLVQHWHYKLRDDAHRYLSEHERESRRVDIIFENDVYRIMRKHKLPEFYFYYVMWCLCLTNPPTDVYMPAPEVIMRRNDKTGAKELWVQVFGHTTKMDWNLAWEVDVERQLWHLPGYKDDMSKKQIQEYLYLKFYQPGVKEKDKIKVTRKQLIDYAKQRWGYEITLHYLSIIFYRIKNSIKTQKK